MIRAPPSETKGIKSLSSCPNALATQLRGRYNQLKSPVRAAAVLSAKSIALGIVIMNWASLMIWRGDRGRGKEGL